MEQNQTNFPATPTLKELTNALKSVSNWHLLGVNLDLSGSELATIERDYRGDNTRCKTEMLYRWLEKTTCPSWEAVVQALGLMEAYAAANRIQEEYITSTATTEESKPQTAKPLPQPVKLVKPRLRSAPPPPKPKPRRALRPSTSPTAPPKPHLWSRQIDLNNPAFDEFNLSDEDLAELAACMVDDRGKEGTVPSQSTQFKSKNTQPFNYSDLPTPPGFPPIPTPAARPHQLKGEEINPEIPIPKTTLEALEQRLAKYKKGRQSAQEKGESPRERRMGRIVKQYEEAIRANKTRKPFNYSDLPTPPGFPPIPTPAARPPQLKGEEINPEIPIPKTTLEALEQRLAKYKKGRQSAQEKGESPRERRMGRIVKQYEEAIRANKTRKPFNYSDLPTPPGFPPIPTPAHSNPVRRAPPKPTQSLPVRAAASPSTRPLFQPFKGKKCQLQ